MPSVEVPRKVAHKGEAKEERLRGGAGLIQPLVEQPERVEGRGEEMGVRDEG